MKKLLFLLLALPLAPVTGLAQQATETPAPQATRHDKQFLLDYYRQTAGQLEKAVAGLSEQQLHFRRAADKWSISQCLEHIIVTEQTLLGFTRQTMAQAPNPGRRKDIKLTDEEVIKGITDRSHKVKAPKEVAPSAEGKYSDPAQAIEAFRKQRNDIVAYINTLSEEDMRSRITDSPFGPVDAYHSFLYIPGHTARHTLQIEEIKADKNFPGK